MDESSSDGGVTGCYVATFEYRASWGATWIHPYWGLYYSLSYLEMARGFALTGDTLKAKKAFQNFFELWKDADPDVPILKQGKAEYAKLH